MKNTEAIEILKKSNEILKQRISELCDKIAAVETSVAQKKNFYDVMRNVRAEYAAVETAVKVLEDAGKICVATPAGTLVVEDKLDPDYPGVNIFLTDTNANDKFTGNGMEKLAMFEFDGEKCKLQAVVYGDSEADDYTDLVEYRKILK